MLSFFKDSLLDSVFPLRKICLICESNDLVNLDGICNKCISEFEVIFKPCKICTRPTKDFETVCFNCKKDGVDALFDKILPCFNYNYQAKHTLYRYKFGQERYFSCFFASMLYERLLASDIARVDCIVPIMSGKSRARFRGFEHMLDVCNSLSKLSKIPTVQALIRKDHKYTQVSSNAEKRYTNLSDAFLVDTEKLENFKNILLIDDVYTTGATFRTAAFILKPFVDKLYGFVLFRA